MPRIDTDIHITRHANQNANQMNCVSAYTHRNHQQQSEIRASTSKGFIATRGIEAELSAAPLPSATTSGQLSLISAWLSTLPRQLILEQFDAHQFGCEQSALPTDVDANVGGLDFIEHPPLVLRVFWVFFSKIVPDDLPRSMLVGVAEFPSEFGRFICGHSFECRP